MPAAFPDQQRPPRICVAVSAESSPALLAAARQALEQTALVELRLDSLAADSLTPKLADELITAVLTTHPHAHLVVTCRRMPAGGHFSGSAQAEVALLTAAAQSAGSLRGPSSTLFADLAIESAHELGQDAVAAFLTRLHTAGARLLLSAHDFHSTGDLEKTLAAALAFHPDAIKIVSTAHQLADNLRLRELLTRAHPVPVIAMAMGEAGLPSRILGPAWGSLFTFASLGAGRETAPGQVSASTLRELYRADEITPATRLYGIAGQPVAHSLSPAMHSAAFRALGLDAILFPLATADARDLITFARELPLQGCAVTMPLKTAILPLLDDIDPLAARAGAVNTLVRSPQGTLTGYNTDIAGVLQPLAARLPLAGARVLVLGAGGAARAAVFGLLDAGAEVSITSRTPARAQALAQESGATALAPDQLATAGTFDVLLQATPAGMGSNSTLPAPLTPDQPIPARLVFEMIYHPLRTPLVVQAEAQGIPVIDGLEMFAAQGARQCELWTGTPAPHALLRDAIEQALAARAASAST